MSNMINNSREYDCIVSGYSGVNYFIRVDELPQIGITQIVKNYDNSCSYIGGNGVNISYYLKKLGLNPLPVIRVGKDYSTVGLKSFWEEHQLSVEGMTECENDMCSICYMIENRCYSHRVLFYPGAMDGRYAPDVYPSQLFQRAGYLLMSVASAADNRTLLRGAKETHTPLVFSMKYDPDGYPIDLLSDALSYASIIFMNEDEEEKIVQDLSLQSIHQLFVTGQAETIVITMGSRGSRLLVRNAMGDITTTHIAPTKPDCVVDTAGAGDSFAAGYLYAMAQGENPWACAKYGSTVASFIIEQHGCLPPMPTSDRIKKRHSQREE